MLREKRWSSLVVCGIALAGASLQLIAFTDRYAVNVLFWDQWDLADAFFQPHSLWERFDWQHGPHRQGLGNLVVGLVWAASRWNVRAEAFVEVATLVASSLCALALVRSLSGRWSAWDAAVPLLFVSPTTWELVAMTPNPAHGSLPLLLVSGFCLGLLLKRPWLQAVAIIGTAFLATFTGFGIFLAPCAIVLCLARAWRDRSAAVALTRHLVSMTGVASALAIFFVGYHFYPAVDGFVFPWPRPWEYVPFVGLVIGQLVGLRPWPGVWWLAFAIGIALFAMASWLTARLFRARDSSTTTEVLFTLTTFSALFAFNAAVGRICLGPWAAVSSRYAPYAVPAVFAAHCALRTSKPSLGSRVAIVALTILVGVPHLWTSPYQRSAERYAAGKRRWIACYLDTSSVEVCDRQTAFAIYPDPARTRLATKLERLKRERLSFFASYRAP